jgi:hypothetical protein
MGTANFRKKHRETLGGNMAKRKKRTNIKGKGRATARGKARKTSKLVRGKKTKRTITKTIAPKKARAVKPTASGVETVVVDVIEQPAPGVITVTEFEETRVTRPYSDETEDNDEA